MALVSYLIVISPSSELMLSTVFPSFDSALKVSSSSFSVLLPVREEVLIVP